MNKGLNGHIAMLSTQIICGLNVPVGKSLLAEWMTPIGLASSRVLFATLIFWTIGLVFRREKVNAKDLMVIALGGISGVACTYLSFAWGLNYTTPVHFALIVALNPIVVMLFSVLFLKEAINRRKLTGVLLGIAGAWVLISQMDIAASVENHILGIVFAIVNTVMLGFYLIIIRRVAIVPQVSGRITRLCVKEGEQVKTGQVLAVIDQVPYQAALRTAQANVSAAQAKVETARIELQGKQALFDEKVISDYELSLARNGLAVALAELEQAKAQETDARNNLSYTEIKSPSNGVVGTLPFRIGALVSPGMTQPFTVVSDNAEMYAYFSVSENKLRQFRTQYGSIDKMISQMPEVGLQLNDGTFYGRKGRIETVSGVVNATTGAVQIKARFPNPDRELLSGTIGNIVLQGVDADAILLPKTATVELQDKIIAYRLRNGKAEAAYLTVDRLNDGNHFVVKQGVSVGDTIITEGVGLVKEGMIVTPKNVTP